MQVINSVKAWRGRQLMPVGRPRRRPQRSGRVFDLGRLSSAAPGAAGMEILRATLSGLAALVETRDPIAANHLERLRGVCQCICKVLLRRLPALQQWPCWSELVADASALHDIGKAIVPDRILLKPTRLTRGEMAIMRTHTTAGYRTLRRISAGTGRPPLLRMAAAIAWCHHERWDGTGYPRGLRGRRIPLPARIVAVADVFDALISRRCYKTAMTPSKAREHIQSESGRHFDPQVAAAFEDAWPSISHVVHQTSPRRTAVTRVETALFFPQKI